jgi:hypothetical protein
MTDQPTEHPDVDVPEPTDPSPVPDPQPELGPDTEPEE